MTALLLWGWVFIGSAIMTASWGRLSWQRFFAPVCPTILRDRSLMVRTMLAVGSVGLLIAAGYRIEGTLHGKLAMQHEPLILVGLSLMAISKAGLVWTAGLDAEPWSWRLFLLGCAGWTGFVGWWVW